MAVGAVVQAQRLPRDGVDSDRSRRRRRCCMLGAEEGRDNWLGCTLMGQRFTNRRQAGRALASALERFRSPTTVVLALPRGGVPVGFEVAQALGAPLDVVLVRKIGAPGQPELGIGAVVDGPDPQVVLNEDVMAMVGADAAYFEAEKRHQLAEIERRRRLYRGERPPVPIEGRTVLLVDDGIATGGTARAALKALARAGAARVVLAVPVAPRSTIEELRDEADEIVCLSTPEPFYAVGNHYADFDQTSDSEVVELLQAATIPAPPGTG